MSYIPRIDTILSEVLIKGSATKEQIEEAYKEGFLDALTPKQITKEKPKDSGNVLGIHYLPSGNLTNNYSAPAYYDAKSDTFTWITPHPEDKVVTHWMDNYLVPIYFDSLD